MCTEELGWGTQETEPLKQQGKDREESRTELSVHGTISGSVLEAVILL